MQVRQEQVAFAVAAVLIGVLVATDSGDAGRAKSVRPKVMDDLVRYPAPDAPLLTDPGANDGMGRALFSPPRDTRPLDPLAFAAPPLPPLSALAPPPVPGPAPRAYAQLLQTERPTYDVIGLFDDDDPLSQGEAALGAVLDGLAEVEGLEGLDLRTVDVTLLGADGSIPEGVDLQELLPDGQGFLIGNELLDAEERRQREATYYLLYDWIRVGELSIQFGRILNPDPTTLGTGARAGESIVFEVYDPDTGRPEFSGTPPFEYERERVLEFGLADTLENRLRLRFADLDVEPTPGTVGSMFELAGDCLAARFELPEALELAESLYARIDAAYPDDPAAGVGLARTFEAEFDFERAYAQYQRMLERFDYRAEVLAGLAGLEGRFRLFEAAEARLRRAVEVDSGNYVGHAGLGRLMLELGRYDEAVASLQNAFGRLPSGSEIARERQAVRLDLGRALLAVGDVATARQTFADALSARAESEEALAGLAACAYLGDEQARVALPEWMQLGDAPPIELYETVGFDLLHAAAMLALQDGRLADAVRDLERAAEVDPLRAASVHRTLSWVAECVDEFDVAIEQIELALEADPTDTWSHYQRARLLLGGDQLEPAYESYRRALEDEADFEDALVGLGFLAWRRSDARAAELYFERAGQLVDERLTAVAAGEAAAGLGLEPRTDIATLRGYNLLELEEFLRAQEVLEAALQIDARDGLATGGLAWAIYRLGDVDEALIQLRSIDDALRDRPDDDPLRVWARAEIERLALHVSKDVWMDSFEYSTLGNGWERREAAGPVASLDGGELVLSGNFRTVGEARYERIYQASKFVSIEARIKISGDSNARAGLFVSRETGRGERVRVQAYAAVARSRDGVAQVRTVVPGREQDDWVDLPQGDFPFPADEWMQLAIERRGEGAETTVTIFLDGIPVVEELPMTNLARGNNAIQVGLFAEGDTGRKVEVRMDDVRVVRLAR